MLFWEIIAHGQGAGDRERGETPGHCQVFHGSIRKVVRGPVTGTRAYGVL